MKKAKKGSPAAPGGHGKAATVLGLGFRRDPPSPLFVQSEYIRVRQSPPSEDSEYSTVPWPVLDFTRSDE